MERCDTVDLPTSKVANLHLTLTVETEANGNNRKVEEHAHDPFMQHKLLFGVNVLLALHLYCLHYKSYDDSDQTP